MKKGETVKKAQNEATFYVQSRKTILEWNIEEKLFELYCLSPFCIMQTKGEPCLVPHGNTEG